MAAGGEGMLGGYDYEFVSEVPDKWMCLICRLPLKDPMQIRECGHRLCQICMYEIMRRPRAACPVDRKPISRHQVFADVGCEREIQDLIVKCPFQDCSWIGELRAVEGSDANLVANAHENNCLAPCENSGCAAKIRKNDLQSHMSFTCQWRIVICKHCHNNLPSLTLPIHSKKCKRFPLTCENKCGVTDIPREKMKTHLSTDCPLTVVPCSFKNLGCDTKAQRRHMEEHTNSAVKCHLELACTKIQQQEATSKEHQKTITEQVMTLETMRLEFCKMKEEIEKSIATLMDRSSQKRTNETFRWDPGEIDYRSRKVVSSDPFYLRGYKMVLFLRPLKSQCDRNVPVSVGLHIITGKYDSEVEWPLTRMLQVKISKQNGASGKIYFLQKDQPNPIPRPQPNEEITISVTTDANTIRSAFLTVTFE